jgi:hypothetical protein
MRTVGWRVLKGLSATLNATNVGRSFTALRPYIKHMRACGGYRVCFNRNACGEDGRHGLELRERDGLHGLLRVSICTFVLVEQVN